MFFFFPTTCDCSKTFISPIFRWSVVKITSFERTEFLAGVEKLTVAPEIKIKTVGRCGVTKRDKDAMGIRITQYRQKNKICRKILRK